MAAELHRPFSIRASLPDVQPMHQRRRWTASSRSRRSPATPVQQCETW